MVYLSLINSCREAFIRNKAILKTTQIGKHFKVHRLRKMLIDKQANLLE